MGFSFTPNGVDKLIVRDSIISSTGNGAQGAAASWSRRRAAAARRSRWSG
jgi:hypothetical protein